MGAPVVGLAQTAAAALVAAGVVLATGGGSAESSVDAPSHDIRLDPADAVQACAGPPRLAAPADAPTTDEDFAAVADIATTGSAVALAGKEPPALTVQASDATRPGAVSRGTAAGEIVTAQFVTEQGAEAGQLVARAVPDRAASGADPAALSAVQAAVTPSGDLRGLAASGCAVLGSDLWLLGGATTVGSSARLDLVNPGATPTTVDLTVLTEAGSSSPEAGQGVSLAPGERREVLLEGLAPGAASLGVRVAAAGGPVGASIVSSALGGLTPAGVETIVPGSAPAAEQVVPGVVVRARSAPPLLRLVAPGGEDAVARWRLLGPKGQVAAKGTAAATVPAGSALDVPLQGLRPGDYTVVVEADGPVAAAVRTSSGTGRGPTDVAWSGSAEPLAGAVPAALPGQGAEARLLLYSTDTSTDYSTGGEAHVDVRALAPDGSTTGRVRATVDDTATATVDVGALAPRGAAALVLEIPEGSEGVRAAVDLTVPAAEGPVLTSVLAVRPPPPVPGSVTVVQSSRW